jgi:hypothetical protein
MRSVSFEVSEVSAAANMKTAVFWDVTPYGFRKSRRLGGKYYLYDLGETKSPNLEHCNK